MIIANLATYPPRRAFLSKVIDSITPQVDQLNIVLNEYKYIPASLQKYQNVHFILPPADLKDTGKFYPNISDSDYVFLIDDDFIYPNDYVIQTLNIIKDLSKKRVLGGYHCSVYQKPQLPRNWKETKDYLTYKLFPNRLSAYRKIYGPRQSTDLPIIVDQVGSGLAVMRSQDMPPFSYMMSSQKFVDVRLAKWCFENGIERVSLPADKNWIRGSGSFGFEFDENIANDFTYTHPVHVTKEIKSFAFKTPGVGSYLRKKTIKAIYP